MKKKEKAMFICSSGGHLTQILQLKDLMEKYDGLLVTEKNKVTLGLKSKYNMKFLVFSSRKKILTFPFLFIYNCFKSLFILIGYNPKYIISTGAGTALPMCYLGKLFGKKIIYIESFARRTSKSLSGKLIYPIANLFIVQWEEMLKFYPKAKYFGTIY